ncbi:TIGR04076 family protein [Chloroflexota bacterium]
MAEEFGSRVTGTITQIKGKCFFGHQVGDKFELSVHSPDGLCGLLYHNIFPYIIMLQYGGKWPEDKGELPEWECPDRTNAVRIKLSRED